MTKPLTDALLKVAGSRQERQRLETSMTPATRGLHQPHRASPSPTKGSEANRGHIPPDMLVQGERCFIKRPAPRQRARGEREPCQDHSHGEAGSLAAGRQTVTRPCLYKGAWTLRIGRLNPSSSSSRQYSSRSTASHRVLRIKTKAGSRVLPPARRALNLGTCCVVTTQSRAGPVVALRRAPLLSHP
jgi:hypothetical protein